MNPGQLRHRIVLQQLVAGQDAAGQPGLTWADFATVWADIRYASGSETVKADMPQGVKRASIRIRYLAGVLPAMRATFGGDVFDIKAVLPDPTGRVHLDLAVETGANQG
jgi:SPP1 family predicted phage head-tail adaptor